MKLHVLAHVRRNFSEDLPGRRLERVAGLCGAHAFARSSIDPQRAHPRRGGGGQGQRDQQVRVVEIRQIEIRREDPDDLNRLTVEGDTQPHGV